MKRVYNNEFNYTDLDVYECGEEQCKSNHSFGPGIKEFYKIHYIHRGKGTLEVENQRYSLGTGQGFVTAPNTLVYYEADGKDPWEYSWVSFSGFKAEKLLRQSGLIGGVPIFDCPEQCFIDHCLKEMMNSDKLDFGRDAHLRGYLYLILSRHLEISRGLFRSEKSKNQKEIYVRKAIEFIDRNYDKKITVESISKHIGIDSKHLWKVFHTLLATSPVKYLLNKRVEKACDLMENNFLSIADISRSVGYEDALQFSKMFKRIKGVSPNAYRKENIGCKR